MNDLEEAPLDSETETPEGTVTGAAPVGWAGAVRAREAELAATRAADRLRHLLSDDEETRVQVLETLQQLSVLQAQLEEWAALHHGLHELLAAFFPFHTSLHALEIAEAEPAQGRALLRGWRHCQAAVDRLRELESNVTHIQLFPPRDGPVAPGLDWGTRIAWLRREVEDRLREERWSIEGLIDLADAFDQACHCYLSLTDQELDRTVQTVRRVYSQLVGGLR